MLTTNLFEKVNLRKNYDFLCKVLEFPVNFGNKEREKEFRGKITLKVLQQLLLMTKCQASL